MNINALRCITRALNPRSAYLDMYSRIFKMIVVSTSSRSLVVALGTLERRLYPNPVATIVQGFDKAVKMQKKKRIICTDWYI